MSDTAGELPTGTVSLLFTDIEGSTRLLSRLGPAYADALDAHRRKLRTAWAEHGGREMGTEGDSFFVVFPTASGAVAAAVQAQVALHEGPWPGQEELRVRMGIHTGFPRLHDGSYVGMDVHRAARIASAAHGGQIVLSSPTAELVRAHLPAGVSLRDLGSHRLKDLPAAEHLLQVVIEGLASEFPPLRTLGAASSLPHPATSLVGRDDELADATALLRTTGVRLVTLTGPGGTGKTRLAIALAERLVEHFPDGVFFVPLATATTAEAMRLTLAEVLGVPADRRTAEGVAEFLGNRTMLLVLDNLEQIEEADAVVDEVLHATSHVMVLASSRRALSLSGEHLQPVPPLDVPDTLSEVEVRRSAAVELFVQQAKMVQPSFALTPDNAADVARICQRLDGLPLAIELAAARIRLLSPRSLLARLEGDLALDIATSGRRGPARQRTLRDTIAWSYDLLEPAQRVLFRRLGVFRGGADLTAIDAVTVGPERLGQRLDPLTAVADLVDASLATVHEDPDGEPRVELLETIRSFALDQLSLASEAAAVRSAHAAHYRDVAKQLESLRESQFLTARSRAQIELDNFREALAWTLPATPGDGEAGDARIGVQLCAALGWFWYMGGHPAEGRSWFERVLERSDGTSSAELAYCYSGLANVLITQGEFDRACALAARSVAMARACGDEASAAFALGVLGTAQLHAGDVATASHTLEEALELHRRVADPGRLSRALGNLAGVAELLGEYERSEALTREALTVLEGLDDLHEMAVQEQNLAQLLAVSGRADEANRLAQQVVDKVLKLQSPNLTLAFANTYLNVLARLEAAGDAVRLLGAEDAMRERIGVPNPYHQEEVEEVHHLVDHLISPEEWDRHYQRGRSETLEVLLGELSARH